MNDFTATPEGALMSACALGALMLALIVWATTRSARARASEKARAWAELKRPEWEARAARKREARASGARTKARIRGALMIAVAIVAIGATNLSAHGTITMIQRAGLESLDAAISVIVVFEMFLAILGALSYWHMHHGTGWNKYEAGVWLMAALMGGMSWWGAGSAIFALWPILAAVAWHLVITFGRPGKGSPVARWWRARFGVALSGDASAQHSERLHSVRARHGIAANVGPRILRPVRAHLYRRAQMRAQELGIYGPDERASEQLRAAVYYVGARALAPESVARMNPWSDERASAPARIVRAPRPVSAPTAPAIDMSAHVPDDARALTEESAPALTVSAHHSSDTFGVIAEHFAGPVPAMEWTKEFFRANGKLPTGDDLAKVFAKTAGNCRKWLTPVRKELGLS